MRQAKLEWVMGPEAAFVNLQRVTPEAIRPRQSMFVFFTCKISLKNRLI